jgi:hypothetical protein
MVLKTGAAHPVRDPTFSNLVKTARMKPLKATQTLGCLGFPDLFSTLTAPDRSDYQEIHLLMRSSMGISLVVKNHCPPLPLQAFLFWRFRRSE